MSDDSLSQLQRIIEAVLLASDRPLTTDALLALFAEQERPTRKVLELVLTQVEESCQGRGFELRKVASGYRFQVCQDLAPWVGRLWEEKPQRYSRALLETLSLIAYRQPITRGDIEDIRGVTVSSSIIRTLLEREWVRVVGHKEVPGRPAMYATSKQFLDYFNLESLAALPPLAEVRDLEAIGRDVEDRLQQELAPATDESGELTLSDEEQYP
ncbi:MAG: SMC-Scp complex subunit ScpB [Halomonadaceae bacterium]|nr:MAG: SMC-Scp complex subunit ScpB [Halomonadaceae bacterium]